MKMYKLADFGFAKRNQDTSGTVLGTEHYMSPQIYSNDHYSYEVDMWAFAVLFYFMLNMEFPFRKECSYHRPEPSSHNRAEKVVTDQASS